MKRIKIQKNRFIVYASLLIMGVSMGCGLSTDQETPEEDTLSDTQVQEHEEYDQEQEVTDSQQELSETQQEISDTEEEEDNGYDMDIADEEANELKKDTEIVALLYQSIYQEAIRDATDEKISEEFITKIVNTIQEECDGCYAVMATDGSMDLKNYELVDKFLTDALSGKSSEVTIYRINQDANMTRTDFSYDGEEMIKTTANAIWNGTGTGLNIYLNRSKIEEFTYTEKGYFFYTEDCYEGTEVVGGTDVIRVLPMDSECRSMCENYIAPIGYQGNNLFLVDWEESSYDLVNFNDLYEYLYLIDQGEIMNGELYEDGIPEDEFETMIEKYFTISTAKLRKLADYQEESKSYPWIMLGCANYHPDMWGTPEPEVTKVEKMEDGTIRLTVDAVWEEHSTDAAFTHEVTIRLNDDGSVQYLSNKILPSETNLLPQYESRL